MFIVDHRGVSREDKRMGSSSTVISESLSSIFFILSLKLSVEIAAVEYAVPMVCCYSTEKCRQGMVDDWLVIYLDAVEITSVE